MSNQEKYSHYYKDVSKLKHIDVYRVLTLFNVSNPCIQHAVKKLLCSGIRGTKTNETDIREAIVSLNRALQMMAEDETLSPVDVTPRHVKSGKTGKLEIDNPTFAIPLSVKDCEEYYFSTSLGYWCIRYIRNGDVIRWEDDYYVQERSE